MTVEHSASSQCGHVMECLFGGIYSITANTKLSASSVILFVSLNQSMHLDSDIDNLKAFYPSSVIPLLSFSFIYYLG